MFNALFIARSIAYCVTTACLSQDCAAAMGDDSPISTHELMLDAEVANYEAREAAKHARFVHLDNQFHAMVASSYASAPVCQCQACADESHAEYLREMEQDEAQAIDRSNMSREDYAMEAYELSLDHEEEGQAELESLMAQLEEEQQAERGFHAGLQCELCGDERNDSPMGICASCDDKLHGETVGNQDLCEDCGRSTCMCDEREQEKLELMWHEADMQVLRDEHAEEFEAEEFGPEFTEAELKRACQAVERARIKALLQGVELDIQAQSAEEQAEEDAFRLAFIARFKANNPGPSCAYTGQPVTDCLCGGCGPDALEANA